MTHSKHGSDPESGDGSEKTNAPTETSGCCGCTPDYTALPPEHADVPKYTPPAPEPAPVEAAGACCGSKAPTPPPASSCCGGSGGGAHSHGAHGHGHGAHDHSHCAPADSKLPIAQIAEGELPADKSKLWICPMCPKVYAYGPAACPICGMALERAIPSVDDGDEDHELDDMRRRLVIALVFTIPLFIIAMGDMVLSGDPIAHALGSAKGWVELALATPVVFYSGWPFMVRAVNSVKNRALNMFTLIGLGVAVAWLYSVFAVAFPGVFPEELRGHGGVGLYFESAAVITTLVLVGQVLELGARKRTGAAIRSLLALSPRTALRIGADGNDQEISIDDVQVGDLLRVRPGENVPVDGVIVEGVTLINEAAIRGEPIPVEKAPGDEVIGATTNTRGAFVMRAERVGGQTMLSRIVMMVAEAQRSQAPAQRLADKVAGIFVPTVIAIAILTFIVWAIFGPSPSTTYAIIAALSVLIIACPCAVGLATPMSIMVASGRGAQAGVLFRNAAALEHLGQIDTVIVDKTGTLTIGRPVLRNIVPLGEFEHDQVLQLVASVERSSEHPLAKAIVDFASANKVALLEPRAVEANVGVGIQGAVGNHSVFVGNAAMMRANGVAIDPHISESSILAADGSTVLFAAIDAKPAGIFVLNDALRDNALSAVQALQALGVHVIMATGDGEASANAIAKELGITEVHHTMLPENKERLTGGLTGVGKRVAMVGDGINDAPALARASVGVAMGGGTDIAMENADVTLLRDDLQALIDAIHLSRATRKNIRQNLMLAFGYNALAIPIAAGVLYPFTQTLLSPMIAALAMSFSSVSVISNALRLYRFQAPSLQKRS